MMQNRSKLALSHPITPPSIKALLGDVDSANRRRGLRRVVTDLQEFMKGMARRFSRKSDKALEVVQELSLRVLNGRLPLEGGERSVHATLTVWGRSLSWSEGRQYRRRQKFVVSLQAYFDELFMPNEPSHAQGREAAIIHDLCVERIRQPFVQRGDLASFEALEPFLICKKAYSGLELARRMGVSVGAAKQAKRRLLKQYAENVGKELMRLGHWDQVPGLEKRLDRERRR